MTGQQKPLAQPFQLPDPTLIDLFLCGSVQRLLRFGRSAGGRSEPVACRKLPQSRHALLWRERIDCPHRAFQVEKHLFTAGHFNLIGGLNSKVLSRMAEPYPGSAVLEICRRTQEGAGFGSLRSPRKWYYSDSGSSASTSVASPVEGGNNSLPH